MKFAQTERRVDASLTILLLVQALTLFAALPAGVYLGEDALLLDVSNLAFALVSAAVLTRHPLLRSALLGALIIMALAPTLDGVLPGDVRLSGPGLNDLVALTSFVFNGLITALVAKHVFGEGRVTAHKVQGAVLIYLNFGALFAIAFNVIEAHAAGSILSSGGGLLPGARSVRTAAISYFSLTTLTTTGYGDLLPVHPFARSLANLEAVFGQLFPATLLARIVALHLNETSGTQP